MTEILVTKRALANQRLGFRAEPAPLVPTRLLLALSVLCFAGAVLVGLAVWP